MEGRRTAIGHGLTGAKGRRERGEERQIALSTKVGGRCSIYEADKSTVETLGQDCSLNHDMLVLARRFLSVLFIVFS